MGVDSGAVLAAHDVDADRGFLPPRDPPERFGTDAYASGDAAYLATLDELAGELPDRLEDGTFREHARDLPDPPAGVYDRLAGRDLVRLCQLSAFFASGYVHRIGADPVDRLPSGIARPLYRTSAALGREPILSYDVLCLHNFSRRDPDRADAFAVDNLDAIQRFTHLDDERWFTVIHVAIEAAAGPGLIACADAQRAIEEGDDGSVTRALGTIADSLEAQTALMRRMTEGNDPEAFVTAFRPYYEGFDGVVFEGVDELGGEGQHLRGGSGAQSSALPAIDAALGIDHETTELVDKLRDMRSYMPRHHRAVIRAFADGPDVRAHVAGRGDDATRAAFNRCIDGLVGFRRVHLQQVAQYLTRLTDEAVGTGGTHYMKFLPTLREETAAQKV